MTNQFASRNGLVRSVRLALARLIFPQLLKRAFTEKAKLGHDSYHHLYAFIDVLEAYQRLKRTNCRIGNGAGGSNKSANFKLQLITSRKSMFQSSNNDGPVQSDSGE